MQDAAVVIGGFEPAYMQKLALYLGDRFGDRATVGIAQSAPSAEREDTVWIGSEAFLAKVREREADARCILLAEEEADEGTSVYRYQSCEKLYQQIMPLYRKLCGIPAYVPHAHRQRWVVITSDGAPAELLAFSLTCAKVQSRNSHTLYLNFTACSRMEELLLLERGADLSDLIAAMRSGETICLDAFVRQMEQIDYILPPINPMILSEMRERDTERLIEAVASREEYTSVVIALGTPCRGCDRMLRRATRIFHLTQSGELRECSLREWMRLIEMCLGPEKVPVETVRLPQIAAPGSGLHLLTLWEEGALGQLAQRLLEGEERP